MGGKFNNTKNLDDTVWLKYGLNDTKLRSSNSSHLFHNQQRVTGGAEITLQLTNAAYFESGSLCGEWGMTDFRSGVSESGKSAALNRDIFNIADIPVPEGCGVLAITKRPALVTAVPVRTGNPIPSFAPQPATVPLTDEPPCKRVLR